MIITDIEELIASRLAPTRPLITAWCGVRYRLSHGTLTTAINRLLKRGRIIRTRHGIYRAMPQAPVASQERLQRTHSEVSR